MSFFRRLKMPPVPPIATRPIGNGGRKPGGLTGGFLPAEAGGKIEDYLRKILDALSAWDPDASPVIVGAAVDGALSLTDTATIAATQTEGAVSLEVVDDSITDAKLRDSAGFSVIGKATTGTGETADITAGTDSVLGRVGSGNLAFAQVATGQIANSAVTYAKIQNVSASSRFLARVSSGAGVVEEATPAQAVAILTITARPAQFTANQNDLAITFGTNFFSTDAARDFTGFVASTVDGQEAKIINNGVQNVVLKHLNGSSAAGNQIITPGGTDLTLTPALACLLIYDLTATKWLAFAL